MPGRVPPPDTHDRPQRESREVPIETRSLNIWQRAALDDVVVDERGNVSPGAPPSAVPLSLTTRFQMQERPVFPRPATPPPPPVPTSPPPAPRKDPKRAPLGRIDNKVYAGEIKDLEDEICVLKKDKARLEKYVDMQGNVIEGFCRIHLFDYYGRQP